MLAQVPTVTEDPRCRTLMPGGGFSLDHHHRNPCRGLQKPFGRKGFALGKIRSSSLAIGAKSILFPISLVVRVSGTLATAMVDPTCGGQVHS